MALMTADVTAMTVNPARKSRSFGLQRFVPIVRGTEAYVEREWFIY